MFEGHTTVGEASAHPTAAITSSPLLGALAFDARFRPNMWEVIGNSHVEAEELAPAFTVGEAETGGVNIMNFLATRMRAATQEEADNAPRKSVNSPMVLEKAVRSHAGLEPWLPDFDDFLMDRQRTSVQVFGTL